jgi:plastocyanin
VVAVLAAAPSKVPFYIAGGVLVCWALGVSAVGVRRPAFPGSLRNARFVMLGTVVLVAATMTAAVVTAGESTSAAAGPAAAVADLSAATGGALAYSAKELTLQANHATLNFKNPGPVPHNVTIAAGAKVVAATQTITNNTTSVRLKLQPGTYVFYCSVDSHRQAGMQGTLIVR